jgi:hypothetical protein
MYKKSKNKIIKFVFQSFFSDEISFNNISEENTTISVKNEDELCVLYEEIIKNKKLLGRMGSLDELSMIVDKDLLDKLENKKDYYYLNSELFELYVLDFNRTIDKNVLNYLNNTLMLDLKIIASCNLSENKSYYNKYKNVKKIIEGKFDEIIENQYNSFYFTAF